MQKGLLFIILGLFIFQTAFSQDAIAKLKFEDAEEAYSKGDYATALSKLDDAEKILDKKNIPKILYLRIMAQSKQLATASSIDLEQIALLRSNCKTYLIDNEGNTSLEEKYRDVYKTLEGFKDYEPFDEMVKGAKAGNTKDMVKLAKIYRDALTNIPKATEWLLAAKHKEAAAIRMLGEVAERWDYENNIKPDYKKALTLYSEAYAKNDPLAMYLTGMMYYYGRKSMKDSIAKDTVLAADFFARSFAEGLKQAQAGDDEIINLMGNLYSTPAAKRMDHNESFNWYMKAAEKGNANAMSNLAYAYKSGSEGVPKNDEKAIYYYDMAIAHGGFWCMNMLASYYRNKETLNQKKALEWTAKAAEKGFFYAMSNLGDAYYYGNKGVDADYALALSWYTKAAKKGSTYAMNQLGDIYYSGWGVAKNYNTAKEWYLKAADRENTTGYLNLGYLYYTGIAFTQDLNVALNWFLKGAERNDSQCMIKCADIYLDLKQYDKAMESYAKPLEKGYSVALLGVGVMYYKGLGVKKDYEKAFGYILQAAQKNNVDAMQLVAKLYMDGDGVKKDKKIGAEWQAKYEVAKAKK